MATTIHKVVVVGEGSTQLIRCFCPDASPDEHRCHAIEYSEVCLPEHQCLLQLWDVPEQQETSTTYRDARVVIVASNQSPQHGTHERAVLLRNAATVVVHVDLSTACPGSSTDCFFHGEEAGATPFAWQQVTGQSMPSFFDSLVRLVTAQTTRDDGKLTAAYEPVNNRPDRLLTLLMIGSVAVGKTTLLTMYTKRTFARVRTPIVDFASRQSTFDDKVRIQVWDTAGASPSPGFTKGARGYVMVYDVTSRESFDALPALARDWCLHMDGTVPIVVVGNKCDLETLREVETAEGSAYARRIGAFFVEASASENKNVIRAFELVGAEAARREAERFRTF